MSAYGALAHGYDSLTEDVPYEALADWYEAAFGRVGEAVHTVLDLGCGTGSLSLLLARRGYELIGADPSTEMLSVFQQKTFELPESCIRPMLLCQSAQELDLFGTVEACVSCLDAFNYFPPENLPEILRRLHLFIAPGGLLAFDILAPERMRSLDGECFVDEQDGVFCVWRASVEQEKLHYGLDIFSAGGRGLWRRAQEEHTEFMHTPERLCRLLEEAGFAEAEVCCDGPQHEQGRLFLTAVRK